MFTPKLKFQMELPKSRSWSLEEGQLVLIDQEGSAGIRFSATSGIVGCQFESSFLYPGRGCLPPSTAIAPQKWTVNTAPVFLPGVRGVAGNFYPIEPFLVNVHGVRRSDLGIHFDANVPGSSGCIVLRLKDHWQLFQDKILTLASKGQRFIPLEVVYTISKE